MRALAFSCLLILTPLTARAAEPPGARSVEVLFVPQDDDTELVYAIPESLLERAGSWNPETDDSPLSLPRVVEITRAELPQSEGGQQYLLSSVHLDSVAGRDRTVWYYMIEFRESPEWPTWPRSERVLVMLDGTVVPPGRRPRATPGHSPPPLP